MSHNIRMPLNDIIGMMDISERSYEDIELMRANLVKTTTETNYLMKLLGDALEMCKLQDGSAVLVQEEILYGRCHCRDDSICTGARRRKENNDCGGYCRKYQVFPRVWKPDTCAANAGKKYLQMRFSIIVMRAW